MSNSSLATEVTSAHGMEAVRPCPERRRQPLHKCIEAALQRYFHDLDGHAPGNLYHMVIREVERPLLESVLHYTEGNQSHAAEILGINRGTLRKKLAEHGLS